MLPNTFYHVYNHANGDENLFREEANYYYFLQKWAEFIEPIAFTYAYCLMPNHFHFLIRTREFLIREELSPQKVAITADLISKTFSNLFNAYAKAFNKMYNRRGSLFVRPFKNKEILHPEYLTTLIRYIHQNPVQHGFREHPEEWPYSSYEAIKSRKPTKISRNEVLGWFNSKAHFDNLHQQKVVITEPSIFIDY